MIRATIFQMPWQLPTQEQIRDALRVAALHLANSPIEFLAEGWEFWAFTAGDHVLRFPRGTVNLHRLPETATNIDSLRLERRLLRQLGPKLSVRVPDIDIFAEEGPNGVPFAGHRMLPGEPVLSASRRPSERFGEQLGRLLRDLALFPIETALQVGVPLVTGREMRDQRARHYEAVIRRVFPIASCEARIRIEQVFETYLSDPRNFEFEPRFAHQDLDMNALIDPATGHLSGVIDFGGAVLSSPALDWWLPVFGFRRLGIEDQLAACLEAAGLTPSDLQRMLPEVESIDFNFPLTDILSGLDRRDDAQVEEGIKALNASLPDGLRCD
jgi:aminoglycoside phosphotransferase (APT) family kinase protein